MPQTVQFEMPVPGELAQFRLPSGVQKRLQALLDRQDQGFKLTAAEAREADGLVDMAEWLSLLRLRVQGLAQ